MFIYNKKVDWFLFYKMYLKNLTCILKMLFVIIRYSIFFFLMPTINLTQRIIYPYIYLGNKNWGKKIQCNSKQQSSVCNIIIKNYVFQGFMTIIISNNAW